MKNKNEQLMIIQALGTCIARKSQKANRRQRILKQLCISNELPIWELDTAFEFSSCVPNFCYSNSYNYNGDFAMYRILYGKTRVTEQEFIELLKNQKMLDTYNEHNPDHPANQIEVEAEIETGFKNLTEAFESADEDIFKEKQTECLDMAQEIYDVLKSIDSGLVGKMQKLIDNLK